MMYRQWQGQLVTLDKVKRLVSVHALRKKAENQWELIVVKSISTHSNFNCHSLHVVLDSNQGSHKPFLLVSHSGTKTNELFECNFKSNKLISRFKFDYLLQKCSCLVVLDGPTLLRCEGSALHITTIAQSETHSSITVDVQHLFSKKSVAIERFWAFEWNTGTSVDDSVLVMVQLTEDGEKRSTHTTIPAGRLYWACFTVNVREGRPVPLLSDYVPYEYGCISTCITCSKSVTVDSVTGDFVSRSQFFVGTSFKQVVVFEHGMLMYCVPLEILPHQIAMLGTGEDHLSFAVRSMEGKCYAYKLSANKQSQESGCWQDTSGVTVGDFAGIGHSQLLILREKKNLKFSVTDLDEFSTEESKDSTPMEVETEGDATGSLSDTVKAFQLRKRTGEVQLTEMESELQQKSELINSSLSFMNSLGHSSGHTSTPQYHPGLLCIIPGKVDTALRKNFHPLSGGSTQSRILKVDQIWQRWENGQWIVGLVAKNELKNEISDVCFSLVVSGAQVPIDSSSRIVWTDAFKSPTSTIRTLSSPGEPPAKRQKLFEIALREINQEHVHKIKPGQKMCAILSISILPNWSDIRELEVVVMVSFSRKFTGKGSNARNEVAVVDIPLCLSLDQICSGKLSIHQSCLELWTGEAFLSVEDPTWDCNEHQDLASLLGSQRMKHISVTTELMSWTQLCSIMKRRLPLCHPHALQLIQTGNQSRYGTWQEEAGSSSPCSPNKILDGVALCISPSSKNTAGVSILYRLESQLSLVLGTLKLLGPNITLEMI